MTIPHLKSLDESTSDLLVLDLEQLSDTCSGEQELQAALLDAFVEELNDLTPIIKAASVARDLSRLAASAHALKSQAGLLGARRVENLARSLEHAAIQADEETCALLSDSLNQAIQEARKAIADMTG